MVGAPLEESRMCTFFSRCLNLRTAATTGQFRNSNDPKASQTCAKQRTLPSAPGCMRVNISCCKHSCSQQVTHAFATGKVNGIRLNLSGDGRARATKGQRKFLGVRLPRERG